MCSSDQNSKSTSRMPHNIGGYIRRMGIAIVRYSGYTGIMEKKMETTVVYRGYIGIVEKKMETTIVLSACNTCATCLVSHALSIK